MVQQSKTCLSVNDLIAGLQNLQLSLQLAEYRTQFNLDGTWTIYYTVAAKTVAV